MSRDSFILLLPGMVPMYYNVKEIQAEAKKQENTFIRIFGWMFIAVGLVCMGFAVYVLVDGRLFKKEALPVDARILAMYGADSQHLGTPIIEYTVEGRTYRANLTSSSSSMHPGKTITVYYRKGDPQDVQYLESDMFVTGMLFFMGMVFSGMGTLFVVVRRRHYRKVEQLRKTGIPVDAVITEIRLNTDKAINGRHPIIVFCSYTEPGGRVHLFRSGSFWYHSHQINPRRKVRVYMDRKDPSNYYVDVDSVVG